MVQQTISTIDTIEEVVTTKTERKVTNTILILELKPKGSSFWKRIKVENIAKLIPWIKMLFEFNKN